MIRPLTPAQLAFFLLSDIALVSGALVLSDYLRITLEVGRSGPESAFQTPFFLFAAACLLWIVGLWQADVYSPFSEFRFLLQRLITGHGIASLLFLGTLYIFYRDYSRLQAFYVIVLAFIGIFVHRAITWVLSKGLSQQLIRQRRVLIVGVNEYARQIGATINRHEWAGLRLVGYVQNEPAEPAAEGLDVLGTVSELDAIITQYRVDEVVIYIKWFNHDVFSRVAEIARLLQSRAVNIRLAPDYADLAYFHLSTEDFSGIPLIGVREAILSPAQRIVKRLFDMVVSALVVVLGAPLFLLIMVAIRIDSPGAAVFKQTRIGQYGRPFKMLKFRTMYLDADAHIPAYKQPGDPRVTRVGRLLRRTSLDELPQFINVLRGEMSVVGPRPELPEFVERYEWWQRKRFELPQGITGWWQINGRADRIMHQHTEDDLFYISHYSLWLDVQIVLCTLLAVITGRGAY
jgi:exopolysaccharide biosynthesis polyprenyl glycosylphosphotransferase